MARQEVQDRTVGAGPHQRAWIKHAQPDQRNGSGKDQRQGPAEDAASGCNARSWSGLDEDAATYSQRCIAIRADLRVGCRGLSICAICRPLWHDLDSAGAKGHLAGEVRGIDRGFCIGSSQNEILDYLSKTERDIIRNKMYPIFC